MLGAIDAVNLKDFKTRKQGYALNQVNSRDDCTVYTVLFVEVRKLRPGALSPYPKAVSRIKSPGDSGLVYGMILKYFVAFLHHADKMVCPFSLGQVFACSFVQNVMRRYTFIFCMAVRVTSVYNHTLAVPCSQMDIKAVLRQFIVKCFNQLSRFLGSYIACSMVTDNEILVLFRSVRINSYQIGPE